jgi:hypothetical protein
MVSTSKQMAALVRNLPVLLLQRLALSVTITLSIVRLGERKYRWMNSASYQVRSRRHQHRYLKVHLQHYHPPPKNQSDLSDQPVGKRSHVLLIPQHRSRNTDMQTYRPSTLRDHPLTSNHHSKYPTTMKTQALGAASALSCDYDDFESFARSLHCPMFSLFTFHFSSPLSHPRLHIRHPHSSLSRVVQIFLHVGRSSFFRIPYHSRQLECHTSRLLPASYRHTIALSQNASVLFLMPLVYLVYYGSMVDIHSQTILVP